MKKYILALLCAIVLLTGCSQAIAEEKTVINDTPEVTENTETVQTEPASSETVEASDDDVLITEAGTYTLNGTINGSVIISVGEDEDVELILDGVTISSDDFAAIYVTEADHVTITLKEGTVNTLVTADSYQQIDLNNVDAVIYSKSDLSFEGEGTLVIENTAKHAIVSKDDLVIENGTYVLTAKNHALYGKDCVVIGGGTFTISSGTDAIVSDNEESEDRGCVEINGGSFTITSASDGIYAFRTLTVNGGDLNITCAGKALKADGEVVIAAGAITIDSDDDGIHSDGMITIDRADITIRSDDDAVHADHTLTINGGTVTISAHEGLEATLVNINGGTIKITASDDGINAGQKVSGITPCITINGGDITIDMGQGDTDAVDANGNIIINGGTLTIKAQSPFDYDGKGELNGGTVTVNGSVITSLSNQFGGMGGMGGSGWGFPAEGGMTPPEGNNMQPGGQGPQGGPSGGFPGGKH